MWTVMRRDYSAVLMSGNNMIATKTERVAEHLARTYSGRAVRLKVAKKILTINKYIGRKD